MHIYQEIYNLFVEYLGEPTSEEKLKEYILFVFENETTKEQNDFYCEDHHVVPRCVFDNNLVITLKYEDHVQAHVLLSFAYPIRKILRTLNFMLNRSEKEVIEYRKMWSSAVKKWWVSFKKTEGFIQWRLKRSLHAKSEKNLNHIRYVMTPASIEARSNPEVESRRIERIKSWWTEEKRKQKSLDLIEYNRIHGTQRYKDATNKRWKEMSEENREIFCIKMGVINRDPAKRASAGEKIKKLWESDPEYQQKMKNRKKRGSDGTKSIENWKNDDFREKTLKSRKIANIKKKAPDDILKIIETLDDNEIIEIYGHLSKRNIKSIPNKELKDRIEVLIIKEYKLQNKISKDPLTNRGWYRKSTDKLKLIIKEYHSIYGIIEKHEGKIEEIVNETY